MKKQTNSVSQPIAVLVRIGNLLEHCLSVIGGIAIVIFVFAVFLDVMARVLSHPIAWCQEVALFSYIWAIFAGSAIGIRYSTHFTIDLVINQIKGTLKKYIEFFDHIVIMVFVGVLCYYGWKYALSTVHRLSQPSGIPMICGTICIYVGAACMLFFCVEYIVLFFSGTNHHEMACNVKGER